MSCVVNLGGDNGVKPMGAKKHKRSRAIQVPATPRLSVGQDTYLDKSIEHGLFEACNGNKYLVTRDNGIKFAVALSHRHLPAFTCQPLTRQPLEYGQWWGPCRLRLTRAWPHGSRTEPGVVGFFENLACLDCRPIDGVSSSITIGRIFSDDYCMRDFDGWALEPIEINYPFFERLPREEDSSRVLGLNGAKRVNPDELLRDLHLDQRFE